MVQGRNSHKIPVRKYQRKTQQGRQRRRRKNITSSKEREQKSTTFNYLKGAQKWFSLER